MADPLIDFPVPAPGPPGAVGTMTWLRANVSRFANGAEHAERRARLEARLAALDPDRLRMFAAEDTRTPREYVPVAALARALGATPDIVPAVRTVAAAYQPGTHAPGADAALQTLMPLGIDAITLLVQACEATAALVRGDDPPVPFTRREAPDGTVVRVDLTGRPFGAGPRACPAREHAIALAEGAKR